jgi:AcrR family transcriptional regulator
VAHARSKAKPGREPQDTAETRVRLLRAASSLFAARGFEGTSTRAIAERAGVNQALLRYHFGAKEGLWREVLEQGFAVFADSLRAASAEQPAQRVAALLRELPLHAELVQALTHALLEPGPRRDWLLRERLAPLQARAAAWLGADWQGPAATIAPWMWIAAAIAPTAFGAALSALGGGEPDRQASLHAQCALLEPWLQPFAQPAAAGAWSLAAARRRALSTG